MRLNPLLKVPKQHVFAFRKVGSMIRYQMQKSVWKTTVYNERIDTGMAVVCPNIYPLICRSTLVEIYFTMTLKLFWVDSFLPKSKPTLCAASYRPPTEQNIYSLLNGVSYRSSDILLHETLLLRDFNNDFTYKNKLRTLQKFKSFINISNSVSLFVNQLEFVLHLLPPLT